MNTAETSPEESRRTELRPARGLEEVSHLFLSQSPDGPVEKAKPFEIAPAKAPSEGAPSRVPFLLRDSPHVGRELLLGFLNTVPGVLEEGLRTIDANIPCEPFGRIDLVAVDSLDRLCIINAEVARQDESVLRGIACSDWIVRNASIVRRMYQGRAINFAAEPRLFLVAPDFSPLSRCVAQRSTSPKVCCIAYRTVAMPGGIGILFDRA